MRDDIVWWKIGYCPDGDYKQRIIIPSFDMKGNLNYFIARSYTSGEWQKYKNPPAEKDFIFKALREKNILIRDQSKQMQLENCLRISIGSEEELNLLQQTIILAVAAR